ncbi:hypothetical protein SDC9_56774 [bioreactor metagenome]|uniref:Uncharacterized protein n=1 Tax=bioreactor metagenome TaxID=1076179 RepID=A0A644X2Q9_9ZZZZ
MGQQAIPRGKQHPGFLKQQLLGIDAVHLLHCPSVEPSVQGRDRQTRSIVIQDAMHLPGHTDGDYRRRNLGEQCPYRLLNRMGILSIRVQLPCLQLGISQGDCRQQPARFKVQHHHGNICGSDIKSDMYHTHIQPLCLKIAYGTMYRKKSGFNWLLPYFQHHLHGLVPLYTVE